MHTIEWRDATAPEYRAWTRSACRYDDFAGAANAATDWLICNHDHGVEIQIRVVAVEPSSDDIETDLASRRLGVAA